MDFKLKQNYIQHFLSNVFMLTSLKWLTVAMPLQETSERLMRDKIETSERDKRETREIWSYGGLPIIV